MTKKERKKESGKTWNMTTIRTKERKKEISADEMIKERKRKWKVMNYDDHK